VLRKVGYLPPHDRLAETLIITPGNPTSDLEVILGHV
jgi:hypothetical protein